jgi:hypothetical protein
MIRKGEYVKSEAWKIRRKLTNLGVPRALAYDRKNSLLIRIQTGLNNNI